VGDSVDAKQLRSFGLLVGGAFGIIGLWPLLIRGEPPRPWALGLAVALAGVGLVLPTSLRRVHQAWMLAGHALGWINTRIILGVVYYGLLTPIGVTMRLLGKDPMNRAFSPEADSYRVPRSGRSPRHLFRQF
jgi:hypothetical protein